MDAATELIAGRFDVRETLGRGGMGVVYRAFDRERGVEVALKTLRGISPESVLRFKNEFRALRDLRHPNLVELGELFENAGVWFFTMELVRGVRFLEYVRASADDAPSSSRDSIPTDSPTDVLADRTVVETPPSVVRRQASARAELAKRIAAPRCEIARLRIALAGLTRGLGALHAAGKVHRDVKPSNILVDDGDRVVLLDFGVVAELHRAFEEKLLFGTARYMAPEQARAGMIGPQADWYAVGILVYQALTGTVPFAELSTEHLLELKQHATPPRPSELVDGVPDDLDLLVSNLLQRDPQCRFGEAELVELLGIDDDAPARAPSHSDRIFVGRRDELTALDAILSASRTRTECVVVEGESGIGKSTLVERFVLEARRKHQGLLVLHGRCHERERVPFNALDGVIDDLARYLSTRRESSLARYTPDDAAALVAVFPALRIAFKNAGLLATADDGRGRGFRALRDLMTRLGRRRPVIVAIDDVQWADADSAALLEALVGGDDPPPICIIATKRPTDDVDALHTLRDVRHLALGGLAREDTKDLIRLVAVDAASRADAIIAETGGHPLFVRELARRHGSGPMRLDDVIRYRAEALDPIAQRLLAAVVIAGAPIAQHVVSAAVGLSPAEAEPHVASLTKDQLVRVHGPLPQEAIEPFHDRIRAAIIGACSPDEQRSLHLAIAAALESSNAPADALFIRFEAAGDSERATKYLVAAASDARAAFAFGRAAELFRRALDAPNLSSDRRKWLLVELAIALANDGRSAEAADHYSLAAALVTDRAEQLDLLRRAAERYLMGGRVEQGLDTARSLLEHVDMSLPRTRVRAIGGILWNQVRMRGATLRRWTRRDRRSLHADICWSMGAGLGMIDSLLGAYFSGRAARLALAEGSPLQITRGMTGATIGAALLGRRKRAASLLDAAARAAEQDGTALSAWYLGLARTGAAFMLDNDFRTAHASALTLEQQWYAAGHGPAWETDVAMHFALASQQFLGRFADLARRTRTLIHDAHFRGDLFQEVTLRVRFGVRHLCADDPATAKADVVDAIASWMPGSANTFGNQRMWALWSRTRVAIYARATGTDSIDDPFLVDEWKQLHRSLIGRVPLMRVEGDHAYGTFLLARAHAAKRRGEHALHASLCREVLKVISRLRLLPFPAASVGITLLDAGVAVARGDHEAALVATRKALEQAHVTHCLAYAALTKRRLGELVGGDEGAALIREGDAEARIAGFSNPERACELAIPTDRCA
ncbi:MAG: protein kinase [Myxococcota bacterium]|nr:protein kinase [Myxococcota bacterium]